MRALKHHILLYLVFSGGITQTLFSQDLSKEEMKGVEEERILVLGASDFSLVGDDIGLSYDLSESDLSHFGSRNFADAMKLIPGVMPQKTAYGQGSPYLRGFTGFHTLYTINGIRLNNSIFRSGPNEYSSLLDTYAARQISVLKGASSVRYGSDAIGGVFAVDTLQADLKLEKDRETRFFVRAADAEASILSRISYQRKLNSSFAYHLGVTAKKFGDMRTGQEKARLKNTGYEELDYDMSAAFPMFGGQVSIFWQQARQDDVWRTHKTEFAKSYEGTEIGSDKIRKKDLTRRLGYIRYQIDKDLQSDSFYDYLETTLSYQELSEEQDRTKKDDLKDIQAIDVYTTGIQLKLISDLSGHRLNYGLEIFNDWVRSRATKYNANGEVDEISVQGPVGDGASYLNSAFYAQGLWAITERFSLLTGLRYTSIAVDVDRFENPETGGIDQLKKYYERVVGNAKLEYYFDDDRSYSTYASLAEGFRAPNLSDLTRLDDGRSNVLERPSASLEPERYVNYELGFRAQRSQIAAKIAVYHTVIDNMITLKPESETADGEIITEKRNVGKGYVQGWEADLAYQVHPSVDIRLFHTQMNSELTTYPDLTEKTGESPLTRMQPPTTRLIVTANRPMAKISFVATHAQKQDKLSFSDRKDTQRIPPKGTPEYYTFDLNLSHRFIWLSPESWLNFTVENITDRKYRIHGSGQNELGRNVILSVDTRI